MAQEVAAKVGKKKIKKPSGKSVKKTVTIIHEKIDMKGGSLVINNYHCDRHFLLERLWI